MLSLLGLPQHRAEDGVGESEAEGGNADEKQTPRMSGRLVVRNTFRDDYETGIW